MAPSEGGKACITYAAKSGFPKIPALGIPPSLPPLQNDVTRLSSATASFPEGGFNNQVEGRRSASNRGWQGGPGPCPERGHCHFQKTCHTWQIQPRRWLHVPLLPGLKPAALKARCDLMPIRP